MEYIRKCRSKNMDGSFETAVQVQQGGLWSGNVFIPDTVLVFNPNIIDEQIIPMLRERLRTTRIKLQSEGLHLNDYREDHVIFVND